MQILIEFLPILAFFITYKAFDIFVATGVAIAITIGQMLWLKFQKKNDHQNAVFQWIDHLDFWWIDHFAAR